MTLSLETLPICPGTSTPLSPAGSNSHYPSFHALLIAINDYPEKLGRLSEPVRDAELIRNYLVNAFPVPEGRDLDIRSLTNEEATHSAIIQRIAEFKDDPTIKKNDAILIYYAGHGAALPPPPGWPTKSELQCLVAYDVQVSKSPSGNAYCVDGVVLDVTLATLLRELADVKGNNIVRMIQFLFHGRAH